ncbi:MAG TPA: sigma-70 family RNA polymerase sigma factor [Actinocrinis sp.]|nr:sigma-70 family RNA polymerase sigma factor [Actinocrinis sp.]
MHRISPNGGRDDAALVLAAQAGDQAAMDELVARYLPLLYNIVGRALDGDHEVDDVVQETLFRVVDRLRDLRDPSAFRSWMVAIAVRQVRDRWSARRARPGGFDQDGAFPAESADPGADFVDLTILRLELADQRRETALATRWLDEEDRELLALWWLEAAGELSRAELVEALGLTSGHASVRVQRMKARLDASRSVVRAIEAVPRCAQFDAVARRWDGRPTSAWRKQFVRHVRECVVCARHSEGLVAAERLLAGLALVPVPALSVAHLTRETARFAASESAAETTRHAAAVSRQSAQSTHSVRSAASRGRSAHARHGNFTRHLAVHASGKAVSAVAAAVVAVGAGAAYAVTHNPTHTTIAASTTNPTSTSAATASSTPSATPSASASPSPSPSHSPSGTSLAANLSTTQLDLGVATTYLQSGYNELPQWRRIDTEAAPNGNVYVAWQASGGIHVSPLTSSGKPSGSDIVVSGAQEISGLVALNDGFALLTRMSDTSTNMWGETAAWLVRYRSDGSRMWALKLTGAASNDTAPVLDGALRWDGTRFGAYFVIHGAGGFASGHYGDKLVYVSSGGALLSGGWSWGCSHNEGIDLWPQSSGSFASLCYDDWRSGLFVSTGIAAPDDAPVVQRAQCWAGYCGGIPGGLTRTSSGRFATLFSSTGMASQKLNPADSSGRGWTVTPQWHTHQVAVAFLNGDATAAVGNPVYLTTDSSVDNVNPHIAPYGANGFLVSWESVAKASCNAGTCTGTFTGTHIRVIDKNGRFLTADLVVQAHIAGDIAVLPSGGLVWAAPAATPSYAAALYGTGPTTRTLTIATLNLS